VQSVCLYRIVQLIYLVFYFAEGNTTKRYYGPPGQPFLKISGGIIFAGIFAVVKSACIVSGSDFQIKKSIREGLSTIRLHYHAVEGRKLKRWQLQANNADEANDSDTSQVQYIQPEDNETDSGSNSC
jgi:hypothetical protein